MIRRPDLDDALPDIIEDYEAGASAASLSKKYEANIWSILNRLRKAGAYIRSNKEQNEKRLDLNETQHMKFISIVDGLLLGDGSIGEKGMLRLEQSKKRLRWLDHVAANLADIGAESRIISVKPRDRYIEGRKVRFKGGGLVYTPAYVECQEQRTRWYLRGTKIVPDDVVLTPLSVAYWFAGDGSYDSNGVLCFYTNSFLKKNVQRLAAGLTALGIEARCVPVSRPNEYMVLVAKKKATCRLRDLIEPHLPECCFYKVQFVRPRIQTGKLTFEQAEKVRQRVGTGETQTALANEFGVSQAAISQIVLGKVHKEPPL